MKGGSRCSAQPPAPGLRSATPAMRRAVLPLIAFLAAAVAGCGAGRSAGSPLDGPAAESEEIEILVRNDNFSQVTVYTARGSSYRRLGIVPGKGEATFATEWYLPDIQLRVKFLAGPDFLTERLPVSPGELLELIVPSRH